MTFFTGEKRANDDLQYDRARYCNHDLGMWMSLDTRDPVYGVSFRQVLQRLPNLGTPEAEVLRLRPTP